MQKHITGIQGGINLLAVLAYISYLLPLSACIKFNAWLSGARTVLTTSRGRRVRRPCILPRGCTRESRIAQERRFQSTLL
jgi:hypothetical protein